MSLTSYYLMIFSLNFIFSINFNQKHVANLPIWYIISHIRYRKRKISNIYGFLALEQTYWFLDFWHIPFLSLIINHLSSLRHPKPLLIHTCHLTMQRASHASQHPLGHKSICFSPPYSNLHSLPPKTEKRGWINCLQAWRRARKT